MPRFAASIWTLSLTVTGGALFAQSQPAQSEPADDAPPAQSTDAKDNATVPGDSVMRYRAIRNNPIANAPFSNVPPLDGGYARLFDPTLVRDRFYTWDNLISYWYSRGYFADTIRRNNRARTLSFIDYDGVVRPIITAEDFLEANDGLIIQGSRERNSSGFFNTGVFGNGVYGTGGSRNIFEDSYYTTSRSTYSFPPLLELPRLINYDLFLAQPVRIEPEPKDPALVAIEEKAMNRAGAIYLKRDQDRDEDSTDRSNLRIAAVLYALDGQIERAARDLAEALEDQPELRENPIDHKALGLESASLTSMQARVARQAARTGDANLWALAATLADARGSSTGKLIWKRYDQAHAAD